VAIVGALAVGASAFLPWFRLDFGLSALRVPFDFLFLGRTPAFAPQTPFGRSAGLILIALAALSLLTVWVRVLSIPRRLLGLAALAVPVGFVLQAVLVADVAAPDLFRQLGMGAYFAAAGGLLVAAG
jgi:hypothetical protein